MPWHCLIAATPQGRLNKHRPSPSTLACNQTGICGQARQPASIDMDRGNYLSAWVAQPPKHGGQHHVYVHRLHACAHASQPNRVANGVAGCVLHCDALDAPSPSPQVRHATFPREKADSAAFTSTQSAWVLCATAAVQQGVEARCDSPSVSSS